jgi:hypothetical protein
MRLPVGRLNRAAPAALRPAREATEAVRLGDSNLLRRYLAGGTLCGLEMNAALLLAARRNWREGVQLLLHAGANARARDHFGATVLHETSCAACAELLADAGANLDATDIAVQTPLHLAALRNAEACALALLRRGASACVLDCWGSSALWLALSPGREALVEALFAHYLEPSARELADVRACARRLAAAARGARARISRARRALEECVPERKRRAERALARARDARHECFSLRGWDSGWEAALFASAVARAAQARREALHLAEEASAEAARAELELAQALRIAEELRVASI